jgi:hypothetical protein
MQYLVELTPGREVVYPTSEALRAALRSGQITGDSRIYHRAGSCWLSIMEHPEYRRLLAERRPPDWLEPIPYQPTDPATYRENTAGLRSAALGLIRGAGLAARSMLSGVAAALRKRPPRDSLSAEPAGSTTRTRKR